MHSTITGGCHANGGGVEHLDARGMTNLADRLGAVHKESEDVGCRSGPTMYGAILGASRSLTEEMGLWSSALPGGSCNLTSGTSLNARIKRRSSPRPRMSKGCVAVGWRRTPRIKTPVLQ